MNSSFKSLSNDEKNIYKEWIFLKSPHEISQKLKKSVNDVNYALLKAQKEINSNEKTVIFLEDMGIIPKIELPRRLKSTS